jgi:hypothetical protein
MRQWQHEWKVACDVGEIAEAITEIESNMLIFMDGSRRNIKKWKKNG